MGYDTRALPAHTKDAVARALWERQREDEGRTPAERAEAAALVRERAEALRGMEEERVEREAKEAKAMLVRLGLGSER